MPKYLIKLLLGIALVFVLFFVCCPLYLKKCVFRTNFYFEGKSTTEILDICRQSMKVKFPKSTRFLNANDSSALNSKIFFLKIEMDKRDLADFLISSPFHNQELSNKEICVDNETFSWWTPEKAKIFKSGRTKVPENSTLEILIDYTNEDRPIIYLLLFGTD
jgi:hypothetical protein